MLLPKHQSTWETFAFPTLMSHPLCYVFKRELLYIPFFGWAMARLDMIHIDRSKRAEAWNKVAEQGRALMAQGNWVIMFPEGTRTPRGQPGHLQERRHAAGGRDRRAGGADRRDLGHAAGRARASCCGPASIDVSIGKPIPSTGRQPDELMREVEAWIEAEMRRLDPEAYAGRVRRALAAMSRDASRGPSAVERRRRSRAGPRRRRTLVERRPAPPPAVATRAPRRRAAATRASLAPADASATRTPSARCGSARTSSPMSCGARAGAASASSSASRA